MIALRLGAYYFLIVFGIGFGLGIVRTVLLVPQFGATASVLLELPVILGAAWVTSGRLLRSRRLNPRGAIAMGAFAFGLLLLAEAVLSIALLGRSPREHVALYAQVPHLLGLIGQVLFATFPLLHKMGSSSLDRQRPFGRRR